MRARTVGTTRVFHVGDAVSTLDQIDTNAGKQFPMNQTDSDPDATLDTVSMLHALHAFDPALKLLPAHDRVAWEAVFGAPGACR